MAMLSQIKSQLPEMLELLKTMVEYESPSHDKEACDALVEWLRGVVTERGGLAEVMHSEGSGNQLRATWGSGEQQILILCHLDTVWDKGEVARRPFRVQGDLTFGPGIYDMKAGAVIALFALSHLFLQGWPLQKKVVALFTSDEEVGSPVSRPIIEREAKKSTAVLVLEPAMAVSGALKTARKGVGDFHVRVEGVAAHSGSAPEKGASAVLELAKQVIALHAMTDMAQGTTVNVGVVAGGTRANVVAALAEAHVDLRVSTMAEAERVIPQILGRVADTPGTTVTITGGLNRPPMERSVGIAMLYAAAQSVATSLGITLSEGSTGGGSDGNFTAALGIPTLDGLGAVGDGAHALYEQVSIPHLAQRTALLIGLLEKIGQ